MPEWEYYFHGRGCCISHKVDGDEIDVDFFDDSADYFDTFFYENYLKSLRRPEPPEQRICELHPSARGVRIAVAGLLEMGALRPLSEESPHAYRIADVTSLADEVEMICGAWPDEKTRVWFAALIGDWLAADEAAADRPELKAITSLRAARCREIRRQRLGHQMSDQQRGHDAIRAMADLRAPDLDRCLEEALQGPPSSLSCAALEIIAEKDNEEWCGRVFELFSRIDPKGQIPQPHIWMESLKFLLRHGYRWPEIIASLIKVGRAEIGEAVLLSLEHAPEMALPLIRKGLLTDVPIDRTRVAAILALINSPWSRRELLRALASSDDQNQTADIRAALLECGDDELRKAVLDWEERNPHENEVGSYEEIGGRKLGPFYTFGELALKNCAIYLRYEMESLHDRVMAVKSVVPAASSPSRQWWKFW